MLVHRSELPVSGKRIVEDLKINHQVYLRSIRELELFGLAYRKDDHSHDLKWGRKPGRSHQLVGLLLIEDRGGVEKNGIGVTGFDNFSQSSRDKDYVREEEDEE